MRHLFSRLGPAALAFAWAWRPTVPPPPEPAGDPPPQPPAVTLSVPVAANFNDPDARVVLSGVVVEASSRTVVLTTWDGKGPIRVDLDCPKPAGVGPGDSVGIDAWGSPAPGVFVKGSVRWNEGRTG